MIKKPSPAFRRFIDTIVYKFRYFKQRNKLNTDGSFYYDDKRLSDEQGVSIKTIMRAKRFWIGEGIIRVENGMYRGKATRYWVIKEPERMYILSNTKHDKLSPFEIHQSMPNCPLKHDKLSLKAGQNVTPNKEINELKNHYLLPVSYFLEILEELKGDYWEVKRRFLEQGYSEAQIEEAYRKSGKKSFHAS